MAMADDENHLFGKDSHPCVFCGDAVTLRGDGVYGRIVGKSTVCERCIKELKDALGLDDLEGQIAEISGRPRGRGG